MPIRLGRIGLSDHEARLLGQVFQGAVEGPDGRTASLGWLYDLDPARKGSPADLIAAECPEDRTRRPPLCSGAFALPSQIVEHCLAVAIDESRLGDTAGRSRRIERSLD